MLEEAKGNLLGLIINFPTKKHWRAVQAPRHRGRTRGSAASHPGSPDLLHRGPTARLWQRRPGLA